MNTDELRQMIEIHRSINNQPIDGVRLAQLVFFLHCLVEQLNPDSIEQLILIASAMNLVSIELQQRAIELSDNVDRKSVEQ